MKKITALIMALVMCISLSACGSSTDGTKDSETKDDDKKVTTIPKSEDPIKDLLATKFYYNNKAFTLPTTVSEGKVFFTTWKNFRIDEHKKEGFDFSEAETLSSNYGVTYEVYEYDSNGEAKGWSLIFDTSNDTDKDLVGEEIGKATLRSLEYNEKTPHHEQYVLPNGIKIGSTRKEVLETFGDPTEFSGGENDFIDKLNYYTKVENEEMYTGASFAFFNNEENKDNDVVTAISIYYETNIPSFKIRY